MNHQFSIILPVKNGGRYVKECIQSVLAQTYTRFNFIILDNNSTDGTTEYIRSLKDPRIILHRSEKDLEMAANWNRALSVPTNPFITFIGHDDVLYANYLEAMHCLIRQYPEASIYQTHFQYINKDGRPVRPCQPMPETMDAAAFLEGEFKQTIDSMGTGYLFRAADFIRCEGFDAAYPNLLFADYQLFVSLTARSFIAVSPQTCFSYRLHNSLSISTNVDRYRVAFDRYIHFLNRLRQSSAQAQEAINTSGADFLMFYCRSLSHRLAKSPVKERYTAGRFIRDCKRYAALLGIPEKFRPYADPTLLLAAFLDSNRFAGRLYRLMRGIQ